MQLPGDEIWVALSFAGHVLLWAWEAELRYSKPMCVNCQVNNL